MSDLKNDTTSEQARKALEKLLQKRPQPKIKKLSFIEKLIKYFYS